MKVISNNPNKIFTINKLLEMFTLEKKKKLFCNGSFQSIIKFCFFLLLFFHPTDWKQCNVKSLIRRLIIDDILDEEIVTYQFIDRVTKNIVRKCYGRLH
jgi:hypothetical protein